jgi:RNA polymerase sigma factor (sigma-70 family)
MESHEELLIDGCVAGDNKAYHQLYKKYSAKMLGICMRYSNSRDEAEDYLQEGFIKVFKYINQFKKEGSFEGWIKRIMINTALYNIRKQKKIDFVRMEAIPELENAEVYEENGLDHFEVTHLLSLIQNLPKGCNVIFNLFAVEGYSHKEIAEKLNISEGTSKSQLSRARSLLQMALKPIQTK